MKVGGRGRDAPLALFLAADDNAAKTNQNHLD
jgi:hypothetical protein